MRSNKHQVRIPVEIDPQGQYEVQRKRAKKVLIALIKGLPDDLDQPDFDEVTYYREMNEIIRENLDAASIWAYTALAYEMFNSSRGGVNARIRLKKDPKQIAKNTVRECWDLWQKDPSRYKGPTAFAKDMLSKFEDLESIDVVLRWCRGWKKATTQRAQ